MEPKITYPSQIYDHYFKAEPQLDPNVKWTDFASKDIHFDGPLSNHQVDFSIKTERNWSQVASEIIKLVLKIVLFPWGLYCLLRYASQRFIMLPLYPAQSRILKLFFPIFREKELQKEAREVSALNDTFHTRHVVLEKNGVRYSGLLIGHPSTIHNGNWVLQATGNGEPVEHTAFDFAKTYHKAGFNTLLINGPAVGRSQGHATPESMGEVQDLGMTFLETAVKAKKLVLAGRSLGGAAISMGILQHQFRADVKYLVIQQMTFDSASNIIAKIGSLILICIPQSALRYFTKWAGCEMDSIEASKKLQKLGITEIIVQATKEAIPHDGQFKLDDFHTDGPIIADASKGHGLIREGVTDNKIFIGLGKAHHMTHEAAEKPLDFIRKM